MNKKRCIKSMCAALAAVFLVAALEVQASKRCHGKGYCFLVDGYYNEELDSLITKGAPIIKDEAYDKPILFFDGECGFCDWSVRFIVARDIHKTFYYASLQGETAHKLLPVELTTKPYKSAVLYEFGKMHLKSDAMLRVLKDLNAPWSWLYVFRTMPQGMRDGMYQVLSRYRHHIVGKKNSCQLMEEEDAKRFLP